MKRLALLIPLLCWPAFANASMREEVTRSLLEMYRAEDVSSFEKSVRGDSVRMRAMVIFTRAMTSEHILSLLETYRLTLHKARFAYRGNEQEDIVSGEILSFKLYPTPREAFAAFEKAGTREWSQPLPPKFPQGDDGYYLIEIEGESSSLLALAKERKGIIAAIQASLP